MLDELQARHVIFLLLSDVSVRLLQILGSGMSNKMWEVLVDHAKTCVLGGMLYVYYADDTRNVGVVFNNIYEFTGLISSGQYVSPDSVTESQKVNLLTQRSVWNQIQTRALVSPLFCFLIPIHVLKAEHCSYFLEGCSHVRYS